MKKIICVLLSCILIISAFVSCSTVQPPKEDTERDEQQEQTNNSGQTVKQRLKLPYSASDSLDPYQACSSMNLNLATLMFDSLYTLNENFEPSNSVAQSEQMSALSLKVKIKEDIKFSDGTSLTASHVVSSFNRAKESKVYKGLLEGFVSAVAVDKLTVSFTLRRENIYAKSCLIFPIVKGSGDSVSGSGRYCFSDGVLKCNKEHLSSKKPSIKTIYLVDIQSSSQDTQKFQIGEISTLYKDIRDGNIGRLNARIRSVPMTDLVFIGINHSKSLLKDKLLRKAICMAINKDDIAQNDFQGYAEAAYTPFNPHWYALGYEPKSVYNQSEAAQLLDSGGYGYMTSADKYRSNAKGKKLSFTLVTEKGNAFKKNAAQSIKQSLAQVGIEIKIKELSVGKLREALQSGKYDICLAQIRLSEDMSLAPFFDENGSVSIKADKNSKCISDYNGMLKGEVSQKDFISSFDEQMPFIPICYANAVFAVSNALEDNVKATSSDVYYNVFDWKFG